MTRENRNKLVSGKPLLTERNRKLLTDPIFHMNPVSVKMMGICSALVITVQLDLAIVMGLSTVIILAAGSLIVSILRFSIPPGFRMMILFLTTAVLVILLDWYLRHFWLEISQQLGIFVGLLTVNCVVLNRLDLFALTNKPWQSMVNGAGNGIGYSIILVLVGAIREIFGLGTLMGKSLFGNQTNQNESGLYDLGYENNNLFLTPPFALIIVGFLIWIHRIFIKTEEY